MRKPCLLVSGYCLKRERDTHLPGPVRAARASRFAAAAACVSHTGTKSSGPAFLGRLPLIGLQNSKERRIQRIAMPCAQAIALQGRPPARIPTAVDVMRANESDTGFHSGEIRSRCWEKCCAQITENQEVKLELASTTRVETLLRMLNAREAQLRLRKA